MTSNHCASTSSSAAGSTPGTSWLCAHTGAAAAGLDARLDKDGRLARDVQQGGALRERLGRPRPQVATNRFDEACRQAPGVEQRAADVRVRETAQPGFDVGAALRIFAQGVGRTACASAGTSRYMTSCPTACSRPPANRRSGRGRHAMRPSARASSPQCTLAFQNAVMSTSSVGMLAKVFTALLASASDLSASVPQTRIAASS